MKRLDNYLLTRYPLLWNLRVHLIWPAILLLHGLFALAGYTSISLPASYSWYALRTHGDTASLAVLCAILVGVLWLLLYLRNNAFKSFYPLERGRLLAEAGIILLTFLGLSTFIASYECAAYGHMRALTAGTDLRREADITNLAHHFIPFTRESFSSSNDCIVQRRDYSTTTTATVTTADSVVVANPYRTPAVDTFSYLHYCNGGLEVNVGDARSIFGNDSIAKRWLLAGRRDSVQLVLAQYLTLCNKYKASYRFNPAGQAAEVFAEPGFPVRTEVGQNANQSYSARMENGQYTASDVINPVFIEDQQVQSAITAIAEARRGWLATETTIFFLYFSLGLALALFSFRIMQIRPWFIALIGTGIWCAIFGVLAATISSYQSGYGLVGFFIFLFVAFLTAAIYLIRRRDSKRNAGVLYLWALWSTPAVLPTLAGWLEYLTRPLDIYDPVTAQTHIQPSPVYDWINAHWPLIGFGNAVLFAILLALLFIPLARKWQAMPEE